MSSRRIRADVRWPGEAACAAAARFLRLSQWRHPLVWLGAVLAYAVCPDVAAAAPPASASSERPAQLAQGTTSTPTPTPPGVRRPRPPLGAAPTVDAGEGMAIQLVRRTDGRLGELDLLAPPRSLTPRLQADIPRWTAGGLHAVTLLVHPPSTPGPRTMLARGLDQVDVWRRLPSRYPEDLAVARTADEVMNAFRQSKIALLLHWADGRALEGSLGALRSLEALGVSTVSINGVGTFERDGNGGLTPWGQTAIVEAARLGMALDLSFALPDTREQVVRADLAPVIFSGVGARSVSDTEFNLSDESLHAVAQNGGVVLVPLAPMVVSTAVHRHRTAEWQAFRAAWESRKGDIDKVRADVVRWRRQNKAPTASIADVVAHVIAIRRVAGPEHVGIATGFDAMPEGPIGTYMPEGPIGAVAMPEGPIGAVAMPEGPIGYPLLGVEWRRGGSGQVALRDLAGAGDVAALWAALRAAGISESELHMIQGDNVLRVLRSARHAAQRLNMHRGPAEEHIR